MKDFSSEKGICQCGSGQAYKHCCARIFGALPQTVILTEDALETRNLLFLDFLNDVFGLERLKDVSELKHRITDSTVVKLYTRIAELFPPKTDFEYLLPEPSQNLRALFFGHTEPLSILNNVVRYSLYADEILIFSQFLNPWTVEPSMNPLLKPSKYRQHTLSQLVLIALLAPWIRAGIVHLIPDLGDFDPQLRETFAQAATQRIGNEKPQPDEEYIEEYKSKFSRFILSAPDSLLSAEFKRVTPSLSDVEVQKMIAAAREMNRQDPLALGDSTTEQVWIERGGNLEMAAFIAQATNAFPYTNLRFRWKELMQCIKQFPAESQPWTPLTESFQQLEFPFLNHVDPAFALKLQEDGRLISFRNFLRKIWKAQQSDGKVEVRNFCDELKSEYLKAQADWGKLKGEEIKSGGRLFASIGAGAGSLAFGQLLIAIPSGGIAIHAVTELVSARFTRRAFKQNVPMSIFIDLARNSKSKVSRSKTAPNWKNLFLKSHRKRKY